jgi:hypothetical protein
MQQIAGIKNSNPSSKKKRDCSDDLLKLEECTTFLDCKKMQEKQRRRSRGTGDHRRADLNND